MSLPLLFFILTWNVGEVPRAPENLAALLDLPPSEGTKSPDFYVIGLQEMKYFTEVWIPAFKEVLEGNGYEKLKSVRLHKISGIMIQLYVKKDRQGLEFSNKVKFKTTAYGFFKLWGNKGATSICLEVSRISFCFVNAHLAPHKGNILRRLKQVMYIKRSHDYTKWMKKNLLDDDLVFWFGDLNFRMEMESTSQINIDGIVKQINKGDIKSLWEKDELRKQMIDHQFLKEFKEAEVKFNPTYKFYKNTNEYDTVRCPAWTDRILYKAKESVEVTNVKYSSVPEFQGSDHKPVIALFRVQINSAKETCVKPETKEESMVSETLEEGEVNMESGITLDPKKETPNQAASILS